MTVYLDNQPIAKKGETGAHYVWQYKISVGKAKIIILGAWEDSFVPKGPDKIVELSVTSNTFDSNNLRNRSGTAVLYYRKVPRKKAEGILKAIHKQIRTEKQ